MDDLSQAFIHRLVCCDLNAIPCITLHAYGVSTEKEVLESFLTEEVIYQD